MHARLPPYVARIAASFISVLSLTNCGNRETVAAMQRDAEERDRQLDSLRKEVGALRQDAEGLRRMLSQKESEIQKRQVAVDSALAQLAVVQAELDARKKKDAEVEAASSGRPSYIKTVGCQKEGDGFIVFVELCDDGGKAIPAPGDVSVTIRECLRATHAPLGTKPYYKTSTTASSEAYRKVELGVGAFKRETTVFVVPRIAWKDIVDPTSGECYPTFYGYKTVEVWAIIELECEVTFKSKSGDILRLSKEVPWP